MLIENNADPLQANEQGFGAHGIAFIKEHRDIMNYLVAAGLRRAIQNGDLAAARVMIQDGAPVNLQTETGATALMIAAHAGDLGLVTWLLGHPEIRPDFQEADGWTAVMFAAFFDHAPVVRALLDHGIDLNVRNVRGETVFDLALLHQRAGVVAVLNERLALLQAHDRQAQEHTEAQVQGQEQEAGQSVHSDNANTNSQASQGSETASAGAAPADTNAETSADAVQPEKKAEKAPTGWLKW